MTEYEYTVHDDAGNIKDKAFGDFGEAYDYAQSGLITYIWETPVIDGEKDEDEERIVWSWDDVWDRDEAIARVNNRHKELGEQIEVSVNVYDDEGQGYKAYSEEEFPNGKSVRAAMPGGEENLKDLIRSMFGDHFDLDFPGCAEETDFDDLGKAKIDGDFGLDFEYSDFPEVGDYDREGGECEAPSGTIPQEVPEDEAEKEFMKEIESVPADESPKDMIDGELVPAKDPEKAEVDIEGEEEDLDESADYEERFDDLSDEEFLEEFGKKIASKGNSGKENVKFGSPLKEEPDWDSMGEDDFLKEFGKKIRADIKAGKFNRAREGLDEAISFEGKDELLKEVNDALAGKRISNSYKGDGDIVDVFDIDFDSVKSLPQIMAEVAYDANKGKKKDSISKVVIKADAIPGGTGDVIWTNADELGIGEWLDRIGDAYKPGFRDDAAAYYEKNRPLSPEEREQRRREEAEYWERDAAEKAEAEAKRKAEEKARAIQRREENAARQVAEAATLPKDQRTYDFYYALGWLLGGHMTSFKAAMPDYCLDAFERRFGVNVPMKDDADATDSELSADTSRYSVRNSSVRSPAGWISQWWLSLTVGFSADDDSRIPPYFKDKIMHNKNKRQYSNLEYGVTLAESFDFVFGTLADQDIPHIESNIPDEWFKAYSDGFNAK